MNSGELLPCLFCGSADHLDMQAIGSLTSDMAGRPYRVLCHHIDHDTVCGPIAYGKTNAIAAWNTRTRPATGDAAREALAKAREFVVLFLAFDGRDRNTPRMNTTLDGLCKLAVEADAMLLRAIDSALRSPGGEEWQPIETHAGHCSPILVCRETATETYRATSAFIDATGVWRVFGSKGGHERLQFEPTHCQPLPAPPAIHGDPA